MRICFLFLSIISVFSGFTQEVKPEVAHWNFYAETVVLKNEINLIFEVKLEVGWHTYSQREVTDGPVPTKISITPAPELFELVGNVMEPIGEKKMDEAFGIEITSFEKEVKFLQTIRKKSKNKIIISGNVEYMTCNSVQCNPPRTIPFSITIP